MEHSWQDIEKTWTELKAVWGYVVKANELINRLARQYATLMDQQDKDLLKDMRHVLGRMSSPPDKRDIAAYIYHKGSKQKIEGFSERHVRECLPDEYKHVEFANLTETSYNLSRSDGSEAVMLAGYRITKKDLVESPLDDFKSLLKLIKEAVRTRRGEVAQEPAMSQYLDVWDGIGERPDDCYAGNNFVKYGKMLLATHGKHDPTLCEQFGDSEHCPQGVCKAGFLALKYGYLLLASHPEHGKRFCYTHGELPAPYIDERHSAEAGIQGVEDAIATILVREQSVRHMFDGLLMQTSKWGSIRIDRIVDFLSREGFEIPKPEGKVEIQTGMKPDGSPIMEWEDVYTDQQKKFIMNLVQDYYVAPMDTKTLKGMILEKIISYLREHGVKIPAPQGPNGEYTAVQKQEILALVRQASKEKIQLHSTELKV